MTVAELEERMSYSELLDWEEFAGVEPFLPERVDLSAALLSSIYANSKRGKHQKAYSLSDFLIVQSRLDATYQKTESPDAAEARHLMSTILQMGGSLNA